tara:strand:+ start:4814 stop:5302 length:489 start_codon:yes stop_codon:yes gene_type:complete
MDKEKQLRELIRQKIKEVTETDKQQEADYVVDKVLAAIDAATNKKADYQYASAATSPEVKKLAKDLKKGEESDKTKDEALLNELFTWLIGGAEKWGQQILQKRKGYLLKALHKDPKLQRMAKDFGIPKKDFESKVYDLMKRDKRFVQDLASGKMRSKSAYKF